MMKQTIFLPVAVTMVAGVDAWAQTTTRTDSEPAPQSAKQVRGVTPYIEIKNEPAPKPIVDPPVPAGLAIGARTIS